MRVTPIVVTLLAAVLAACSSPPPVPPLKPGAVANGTAEVTVDAAANTTDAVACTVVGPLTTITASDDESGVTAVVSSAADLTAESVSIRNVGGFTGSFNAGLGGDTTVTLTDRTYTIAGTADGFATDDPSFRTNGTFEVKVAC